jgi:hypothetical protein
MDYEQASRQSDTTHVFTLMDGASVEVQTKDRRPKCLLMSYGKVHEIMCKTCRNKGRNAGLYVIRVNLARQLFRSFLYDDCPE